MNGKNVLTWANGKRMKRSTPTSANWQDVYVVAKWTGGSTFTNHNGIFGGSTGATGNEGAVMNSSTGNSMWTGWANNKYLNGISVSNTAQVLPTMSSPFLFSFSNNSAVSATGYAVGDDRWYSREWVGHFAEVLAFGSKLPDSDRQTIEGYLAHKWGLTGSLPSSHPHKLGAPTASSGTPAYITDTPFDSGKAIDLADGHVEVLTGESEDIFDGGSAFSVSAWVKGWPGDSFAPIISKGGEVPNPKSISSMKLWLDAQDLSTMDKGTSAGAIGTPTNNSNVKYWADKSGNGHHATASATPSYETAGIWNKYPAVNNSGGHLTLTNSATSFDAWNSMSLIFVYKWASGGWTWEQNIKKGNGFIFGKSRIENHYNQGFRLETGDFRSNGITRANVEPKIVCFTYDGVAGKMNWHANGSSAGTKTSGVPSAFNSSSSNSVVFMNRMHYGEIFIFRNALSDTERQTIESHLAIKWGMTGMLPATHLFNTQKGWSLGRGEKENSLITNIKGTGEKVEASHSTALSTDNQWHHIVSTYDGGTRKLNLDGVEVSSQDASGAVVANAHALIFGAIDMNSSAAAEEEVKNIAAARHSGIKLDEVRFYNSALSSSRNHRDVQLRQGRPRQSGRVLHRSHNHQRHGRYGSFHYHCSRFLKSSL